MGEPADNPTEPDWFIVSCERGGNHYGCLHGDGIVHTRCRQQLEPLSALFGDGEPARPVLPMPQGQACRACCVAANIDPASVEEVVHGYRPAGRTATMVRRPVGFTPLAQRLAALAGQKPPVELLPVMTESCESPDDAHRDGRPAEGSDNGQQPAEPRRHKQTWRVLADDVAHLVVRGNARGYRTTACGLVFGGGRRVANPAPNLRCRDCEAQRPC